MSANVTPYSVTVKGFASPDPEKSCARRLVRFFQPVPLTVLRTLALGGRPKERYTEEERELFREIARLKGTLQRLNNYFGGRQYREVFEENQALINELKKILSR